MNKFPKALQDKSNEANSKKSTTNDTTSSITRLSNTMEQANNAKNTGKCRMSVRIS